MSIPVPLDEERVILLHNKGVTAATIAKRFGCSASRVRNTLVRLGFDFRVTKVESVSVPGHGGIRRYGHYPGLGE
jgi:hypothetical protein